MRSARAPLMLIAARARRRPGRWLLPALGLAVATAFAGTVAAEGVLAGDQGARSVLSALDPLERTVRVTLQAVVTPAARTQARALLRDLGVGAPTEVALLNPVRLSGVVVRPAAIAPLTPWISAADGRAATPPRACRPGSCPVLLAGGTVAPRTLAAQGVRLVIVGDARLRSAAPLGYTPGSSGDEAPLLLTEDLRGLDALTGLSGVYRTFNWLALLPVSRLNSWQLPAIERHLARAQAALLQSGSRFSLTAPFAALDAARAQANAAPQRLLLAGGGAIAALALFIVLAAFARRREQHAEIERLRTAGGRTGQCVMFAFVESAWLCAFALLAGAGVAVAGSALLASAAGLPAGGVLTHSLITPVGALALAGGWICATTATGLMLLLPAAGTANTLAIAAAAALALALTLGPSGGGPLPVLLAPLCCAAAGVLIFRGCSALLRTAERVSRRGPLVLRLALVSLARAPAAPSLAIAFIAVSTGLGGFALAYRATLLRGAADQAADRVPLDAIVSPAPDFTTPLHLATLAQWRSIADGQVLPVRRTYATYASGETTVTVPALGVPVAALTQIHGWRASDGSASMGTLAARLRPAAAARVPGPMMLVNARWLSLRLATAALAITVTADLRDVGGGVRQVTFGAAGPRARTVRARLPPGRWELEALELDESPGLAITSGHQNGENPAATTQFSTTLTLGPLLAGGSAPRSRSALTVSGWRGVGAATVISSTAERLRVWFTASGSPGLLRPLAASDLRPVPVLVDPAAAAASTRSGGLALTVDGLPVAAQIVGVLARFPTLNPGDGGFVVADQATLAAALDAQLPGQGAADELWIAAGDPGRLRTALTRAPLAELGSAFRGTVERQLRAAPIARGVLGTLLAATAVAAALAPLGLLVALLGAARDRRIERDLVAQGVGPDGLRRELQIRMLVAGVLGVCAGLALAVLLTRLAVVSVRAATALAPARPGLVTVAPWGELVLWAVAAALVLAASSLLATRSLAGRSVNP